MQCPNCNTINPDDSQYCSKCGTSLGEINDTLTHTPSFPPPQEDTLYFSPGDSFGPRYKIIEEVGRGGMGRVYKAEDKELGITVALKMIHPEYSARTHIIKRFKKETLLARSISHENVIRIYDLGEVDKIKFISMDYIKGQSLKELILTSGTLTVETAINITKQICEALKVAHQKGVIHRDLKPQNILVDSSGKVYVTDFGVAKSVEVMEDSAPGLIIGTIQYISPEQAKGEQADLRSDLYSLGIIIYEMLTGEKPFKAETYTGYIQKHIHEKPKSPSKINPNIPAYLEKIILKCLEKDINNRYQKAEDVVQDLVEQKVAVQPIPRINIKKLLKFVYAGVLIGLIIAVGFLWRGRQTIRIPAPSNLPKNLIAVLYFENTTREPNLDNWRRIIQEFLINDLHQSRYIEVLPNIQITEILTEMDILDRSKYSTAILDRIASEKNVEYFILGSYGAEGEDFWISARILDARTHGMIGSEIVRRKGERNYHLLVDELTEKMKPQFQLTPRQIERDIDRDVGQITTSSTEAMEYYIEGTRLYEEGQFEESIDVLKKALEKDPNFALAMITMVEVYKYLGLYNEQQKYFQKALKLLDRVSDRERYIILDFTIKSPSQRIKNYLKLLKLYPNDEEGYLFIASIYRDLEEWDQAINWLKKTLKINSKSQLAYKNLAFIHMAKGEYEEAKDLLLENKHTFSPFSFHRYLSHVYLFQDKPDLALLEAQNALSLEPKNPFNVELLGNIHHIKNEFAEAEKDYLKLLEIDEPISKTLGQYWLSHLYLSMGQYKSCEEEITKGIALSRELDITENEILFRLLDTYLNLRMKNYKKALDSSTRAIETAIEPDFTVDRKFAFHLQGISYVGMNRLDEAKKTAKQLKRLIQKTENKKHMRHYYHLKGMIEIKKDNLSAALDNFEKAISLLPHQTYKFDEHAFFLDAFIAALYESGNIEGVISSLEKIISLSMGRLRWGDIYARSFYLLGKTYQKKGMNEKAITNYEKFIQLWKNADRDLPEVSDARKQLATIRESAQN
ncbi:MAG: protein kinase [Candidatus Aminicenantes bacterium]|jgi:serine/threonine protein kinase/tetratricopeptide (TPR) repeat protein